MVFAAVFLLALLMLGACAKKMAPESAPPQVQTENVDLKKDGKPKDQNGPLTADVQSKSTKDVTPFTSFTDQEAGHPYNGKNRYDNCYTRIRVTGSLMESAGSNLVQNGESNKNYKSASLLKRLFSKNSCNVSLNTKVTIGEYTDTINLLTLMHYNNDNGEFWSQSVSHSMLNYPLFLVRGDARDAIPVFEISLKGTKTKQSSGVAMLLQAAVAGIETVSPQAKVLTTLTAEATSKRANAIDSTISSLFSNGIAETHLTHRDLRYAQDTTGVVVSLSLPEKECKWDSNLEEVGSWTISFDAPRPSVFSNYRVCAGTNTDPANPELSVQGDMCSVDRNAALALVKAQLANSPGRVLNFQLDSRGKAETIRSFITQQDWYVSGEAAFSGVKTTDEGTADSLCKNIANEIQTLGLNEDDAAFVVQAVIEGLPHNNRRYASSFTTAPFCKQMVARTVPIGSAPANPQ